ncbi:uncharacterized protein DS421_18g633000 [Arachis hypogaea]|nr:uncharacterized protein DS421_18g633000 [Arachis hypogaea]
MRGKGRGRRRSCLVSCYRRRRRPHPESPSSPVLGKESSRHCSAAATVGSPCCRLRAESVREEGKALPSRPSLSPRVPVAAVLLAMKSAPPSSSSRTTAACDVAAVSESVTVKQSAHRGEAVQATAKSPSMKLQPPPSIINEEQPPYLWSPETAAVAATFLLLLRLFVLGIVYRELLCRTPLSELPFHYCRLCSEPLIVASIVVIAAARFSRSSLVRFYDVNALGSRSGCCTLVNLSYCCGCGYRGAVVVAVTNVGPRGKEFR